MTRLRDHSSTGLVPFSPTLRMALPVAPIHARPTPAAELVAALTETPAGRNRIWELSGQLHCSIVGTCLSTAELRQILIKAGVDGAAGASEHDLHGQGVLLAGRRDAAGKLLQKALDRRHRLAISQFAKARTADDVRRLWSDAVQRGDIPGAYWAAMTHPASTDSLVRQIFGEVHMLSHLVGAANRADIRRLAQLESDKAALETKVARQQEQLRDAVVARDATIRDLRQTLAKAVTDRHDAALPDPSPDGDRTLAALVADLEHRLAAEVRRRSRAEERIATVEARLAEERDRRAAAQREIQALREELDAVEAATAEAAPDDAEAAEAATNLRGLSLLYVGGRAGQIARLRRQAERRAATLLHHDGGIEASSGLLSGLVSRADAVLFPVDCVSHAAVGIIKSLCRQTGKPYLPLRSAGLAPFLAALRNPTIIALAQASPHLQSIEQ